MKTQFLKLAYLVMALVMAFSFIPANQAGATSIFTQQTSSDAANDFEAATYWAQSFTSNVSDVQLTSVKFQLYRVGGAAGQIGQIYIDVWTTNATGSPISPAIYTSGNLTASTLTATAPGIEYEFTFSGNNTLYHNVLYAFVLRATSGDASNFVQVRMYNASDLYSNGRQWKSTNSGATWPSGNPTADLYFKAYGNSPTTSLFVDTEPLTVNATTLDLEFSGTITQVGSSNVTTVGVQIVPYASNYSASSSTAKLNMIFYDPFTALVTAQVLDARPAYLVANSPNGPWGTNNGHSGNAPISTFRAAGIKYFEYLDGGYEGTVGGSIPNDITSNLAFINQLAADGVDGIFLDQVSASSANLTYLAAIYNEAHALGLLVAFNTGVDTWDSNIMDYCDYVNSVENWTNITLTASQETYKSRLWLISNNLTSAATALTYSQSAFTKGVDAFYATQGGGAGYNTLPSWFTAFTTSLNATYYAGVNYGAAPQAFSFSFNPDYLGLVSGTVYKYRVFAIDTSTTAYGNERTFTYYPVPEVITDNASFSYNSGSGTVAWALRGKIRDRNTTGSVFASMSIGRTSGAWESNLGIQGQTISLDYPDYPYVEVATGLLPNTTYYYQAYAYYVVDLYTIPLGYGEIKSFYTGNATSAAAILPDVSTVSAVWNSSNSTYTFKGTTWFSVLPIVQRGFNYGVLNVASNVSQTGTYGVGGTWEMNVGTFSASSEVFYQAWAKDSAGNIGYGAILTAHVPEPGGGASVSLVSATVGADILGQNVALVGSLDRIGSLPVTYEGFAWNTVDNVSGAASWWQTDPDGFTVGQFTRQAYLSPNTQYYFWAGAGIDNGGGIISWVWSSTSLVRTTGNAGGGVTSLGPIVTLGQPNNITSNSFNATMTINLSLLASSVTQYGFNLGPGYHNYTDFERSPMGTYGPGDYWMLLSNPDWKAGDVIHFQAWAVNAVGEAVSPTELAIVLPSSPLPPGTPPPVVTPPSGAVTDFAGRLKLWMAGLGMDNATGHWAYMGLLMLGAAFIFAIPIIALVLNRNRFLAIIFGIILIGVEIAIFGTFLFSGLLGIIAVLALIFLVVGIAAILGWRVVTYGRA